MRYLTWLLALALLVGPVAASAAAPAPAQTYSDPFAYCAAVGTADSPGADARWKGPKVPVSVASGLARLLTVPMGEHLQKVTYWRCMDGQVYACAVGANIPCLSQANTSRTPTPGMIAYCQTNSNADFIPMYVRDRANIYDWRCQGGHPVITRQIGQPDARGYLKSFWYRIEPARSRS